MTRAKVWQPAVMGVLLLAGAVIAAGALQTKAQAPQAAKGSDARDRQRLALCEKL